MRNTKKPMFKYRGQASEILEPIVFEGYEIKSLRHGNTNHVLYCYPRAEDGEPCWGMDLETAKKCVLKNKKRKVVVTNKCE